MLQALVAAEQRAEDRGVGQQHIARPVAARGHPEEHVELPVSRFGERMRPRQVDRLPGQDVNGFRVVGRHGIVRQVHVEVEGGHPLEPAFGIQIPRNRQGSELLGSRIARGTQAVAILDRDAESFHQGSRVVAEALLAGHQSVAVVVVLHVAHFQIV